MKIYNTSILILIILSLKIHLLAQNPEDCQRNQTFIKTLGNNLQNESGWKLLEAPNGGIYALSSIDDKAAISYFNNQLQEQWTSTSTLLPGSDCEGTSIQFDMDGNIIATAVIPSAPVKSSHLIKFNLTNQSFVWIKSLTEEECFFSKVLDLSFENNYGLFSQIETSNTIGCDAGFFKIDKTTGNSMSSTFLNLGSCESFRDAVIHNNKIYTCGRYNYTSSLTTMRASVTELSLEGEEVWSKTYFASSTASARQYNILLLSNNNTLTIGGFGDPDGNSLTDVFVHAYNVDLDGNFNWGSYFDISGESSERLRFMTLFNDGYLVGGRYNSSDDHKNFILKFDFNGKIKWAKHYNIGFNSSIEDALAIENNIYLIGFTSVEANDKQLLLIKTDENGNVEGNCDISELDILETTFTDTFIETPQTNQTTGNKALSNVQPDNINQNFEEIINCEEECIEEICETNAGEINTDLAIICNNESVIVVAESANISENNTLTYFLHDGTNSTIYDYSLDGNFVNNSTYPTNTELYISPAVGPPDAYGFADINASCSDLFLPGKPVVFLEPISYNYDTSCTIDTQFLNLNISITGSSPSYLGENYIISGMLNGVVNPNENFTFENILTNTIYTFTITDNLGCSIGVEIGPISTDKDCFDCENQLNGTAIIDDCGECLYPDDPDFNQSCILINEVFIPNAFSPNGDGNNDIFKIFSKDSDASVLRYIIYNRWAEKVYESYNFNINSKDHFWDGSFNKKEQPLGVFVYYIEVGFSDEELKIYKGNLTLVR